MTQTASSQAPLESILSTKRTHVQGGGSLKKPRKIKKFKSPIVDPISVEGTLRNDISDLLQLLNIDPASARNDMTAFFNRDRSVEWPAHGEAEIIIEHISSIGVGLGIHQGKPVVVPFTVPGDKVRVKVYRTEEFYFEAELLEVLQAAKDRDDSLVSCQYFAKCSGCQYQFLSYEKQLELKRDAIVRAYKHLAPTLLSANRLPPVHETIGSPLQYGYRTKLTPHFDMPKRNKQLEERPPIGFGIKGRSTVLDIEECQIGTKMVNEGMKAERAHVIENFKSYKKGATLLLRENLEPDGHLSVTTDNRAIITEKVGEFLFKYRAGEFFQNNNSILPAVTSFVKNHISIRGEPPKLLVDTYCGSGLFAITCSEAVSRVIGVEISAEAVDFAKQNAALNNISNASFIVGQAEKIFDHVSQDPDNSAVVIDPPRKGCDTAFLDQLLVFSPAKIVYVSCNVHSQARDLEYFLGKCDYKVESLGGFDFFPQTHHVESVAVLSRI